MKKTTSGFPEEHDEHEEQQMASAETADQPLCNENGTSVKERMRDAHESMRHDPATHLRMPLNAPGPGEILQGRSVPDCGRLSFSDDIPTLEVTQGNRRWLLLLLRTYLHYLQHKAPDLPAHQIAREDIQAMVQLLEPEQSDEEFGSIDLLFSFSHLYTLREAVTCGLWMLRDWLPACEERTRLWLPLEMLHQEVEQAIEAVIAAREAETCP